MNIFARYPDTAHFFVVMGSTFIILGGLFGLLYLFPPAPAPSPSEICIPFCEQAGGELVLIEGPNPLVCSCVIGEMEVDVE